MWVGSVKRELMENYTAGELRESMPMGIKNGSILYLPFERQIKY